MRIFVIADSSKRKAKPIGVLIWKPDGQNGKGRFSLEMCSNCSEEHLPLSLSFCANREHKRATPAESEDWVRSRIVPESRHNIAEVLEANGLAKYDLVGLLAANQGRSSDDDLLVYEIDVPQEFASEHFGQTSHENGPIEKPLECTRPLADRIVESVRRQRMGATVSYAFVGLDNEMAAGNDVAPHLAEQRETERLSTAAERIGSRIRAKRLEQALTQKQLAVRAGITQTVLSRVESGTGNPTLGLLEEIAAALDCQLEVDLG